MAFLLFNLGVTFPPVCHRLRRTLAYTLGVLSTTLVCLQDAAHAQADLSGTWRAGATAIDVSIESWGEDCGARPASTRSNGGGLVTVEQKGRAFSLHRGRERLCTIDPCPFVGPGKAQQDRGDIAGVEGGGQLR